VHVSSRYNNSKEKANAILNVVGVDGFGRVLHAQFGFPGANSVYGV
jgi:hypothetical protein